MTDEILRASNLAKHYQSSGSLVKALDDVSFSLRTGSSLSVIGPSGSGKTTLLALCAGLDRPTSGEVVACGESLNLLSEDALADFRSRNIGFIFQNFQLLKNLTALENVLVPLEIRGDSGARARAEELLLQVGLENRMHHYPVQLSGGEQQRVAIARAFGPKPKLLFADEPTGNLDHDTGEAIVEKLFVLNRVFGTTLVLVTHNLELGRRCEEQIVLRGGKRSEGLG